MNTSFSWKAQWPHLLALIGFFVLSVWYVSPVLEGKRLNQYDDVQAKAAAHETVAYHEKTGEWPTWTNSMFGGMPNYLIAGNFPASVSTHFGRGINALLPSPANVFLLSLLSAYILFLVLGARAGLAMFGAIAFAFASFNIISIEAGHISKVIAIGYAPGVLAGVIMAFRRNWLGGAALTALFLSLELYANHVQITYYLAVGIALYVLIEAVTMLKARQVKPLIKIVSGLALAAVVAVGTHSTRLWNAYEYTKETTRGKSELTSLSPNAGSDGLDKDYAFNWSYGIGETFTLLVPNLYGGSSQGALDQKSETYKVLTSRGVDTGNALNFVKALPLYWGDQPGTSGPVYAGALVFFLFVLGVILLQNRFTWWALGVTLLYIVWAWGKNFSGLNYLFFDYFPMFNKFRAVTMVLALAQLLIVVVAVQVIQTIIERKISEKAFRKPLLISLGIVGGLALLLAVMPSVFLSFRGPNDAQFVTNLTQSTQDEAFSQQILQGIIKDREGMVRTDAFRSLVLIILLVGALWLYLRNSLKVVWVYTLLIILVVFDTFGVGKRYLSEEDFMSRQAAQVSFTPTAADEQILRDPDPHYRVLDLARNTFNNAEASYFHKSIGGYHGAKLRRYQELIERQIARQGANPDILNMLNTKYYLTNTPEGLAAQPNPNALGNAWFVERYELVPNADAEMARLDSLDASREAVLDVRYAPQLEGFSPKTDTSNTIRLISYKPHELVYETSASSEQLAIFSEVYYNVRDEWKATVDGEERPILRANYVLRALRVPEGKHTITFRFEPVSITAGYTLDLVSSIILVLLIGAAIFMGVRKPTDR